MMVSAGLRAWEHSGRTSFAGRAVRLKGQGDAPWSFLRRPLRHEPMGPPPLRRFPLRRLTLFAARPSLAV